MRVATISVALIGLLGSAGILRPAQAQDVRVPPSVRTTLANGLTVILMEYHKVPVVHFRMITLGGSAGDPQGGEGTASVAATLLRSGTTTRSATEIAQAIDFLGGTLSSAAGLDYCAVNCQVLSKDLIQGLDLFADIILNPIFPDGEIEREKKQRLAGLEALKEDPAALAGLTFNREIYGDHPYGRQSAGTKTSLPSLTRDQLIEFYRQTFQPGNAVLVVVGDFHVAEMKERIASAFSGWVAGETHTVSGIAPTRTNGRKLILVDKPDATQTQIVLGNTGMSAADPDTYPITVANTIFGAAYTSRLIEELRVKRSLTYGASSSFPAYLLGGAYKISTFTKNETLGETVDVVLDELHKYRASGATEEEVHKARSYIAGSFARGLQAPEALAAEITDIELYGLPRDYLETYIRNIRNVTADDVRRVARQYFLTEDLVMVFVGPAAQVSDTLRRYAAPTIIPLKDAVR